MQYKRARARYVEGTVPEKKKEWLAYTGGIPRTIYYCKVPFLFCAIYPQKYTITNDTIEQKMTMTKRNIFLARRNSQR